MASTQLALSSQLADDLLRAWMSRNADLVQSELARSMAAPGNPDDIGEEERRHLVKAVAEHMRQSGNVFREGDPVLEVCANLLQHLAGE